MDENNESKNMKVIELHMMDKRKYYPLALVSGFAIRSFLYPVSLIRTRLQVQKQHDVYKGLTDAFVKIVRSEGIGGLYKGFWVNSLTIVSQCAYLTTYENVREIMKQHPNFSNKRLRSFVSGGCASLVAQTFLVPIDVVAQHQQMQGVRKILQGKKVQSLDPVVAGSKPKSKKLSAIKIIKKVYKQNGLKGFYRGYVPSIILYGTQSASWWFFYDVYCDLISSVAPSWVPRLVLQSIAAPCGGVTTTLLSNPLDVIRTRVQVQNTKVIATATILWKEEGMAMFIKGVTARMTQSVMFSFFIIVGYESIKRFSILDEYKSDVLW